MSSFNAVGGAWAGDAWTALLAFTLACALVALLRVPSRRLFGAAMAFHLWLLPPVAVLACWLPHPPHAWTNALPPVVVNIQAVPTALTQGAVTTGLDLVAMLFLLWLTGATFGCVASVLAQWRYQRELQGATRWRHLEAGWPVWRAPQNILGPALVGVLRPRIVLPSDFEQRYDATEQQLILCHESAHAARRDGCWSLLAQCLLIAFWFHPAAWWAHRAFRLDQELACDAAVLRHRPRQRRSYALAMLKTQVALLPLPLGCHWSTRHPITERIAMLNTALPNRRRKELGLAFITTALLVGAGAAYALAIPPAQAGGTAPSAMYQLDLVVQQGDKTLAAPTLCMAQGQPGEFRQEKDGQGWRLTFDLDPTGGQQVDMRVNGAVVQGATSSPWHSTLHGALDKPSTFVMKGAAHGDADLAMTVTPRRGCPAMSGQASATLSLKLDRVAAMDAALSIAARTGLHITDPMALDDRLVSFNFEQISATAAMQFIADADGRKAIFDGKNVSFASK
ncbi:M56 family metallopeptidase [Dyella sp. 20L07]|uniref:M56 family metallopeptidase n=1 Tax=Dyella sp. 20L07 TaxID=3384240 RepID=UPI003D2BD451